jgi:cbb3-type cytochrome oxidase maturation protein
MEVLVFLVPLALTLGAIGLMGFLWSLKNGQYDDLEGAGWRAIADDEPVPQNYSPRRAPDSTRAPQASATEVLAKITARRSSAQAERASSNAASRKVAG